MSIIVDIEPLLRKYDGMNEGTEFSPIHFINDFLMLLEQQPSEDTEVIKVSKGAVKARQGRFVIYDVEWFKEHFYSEEMIYGQPKQPCEDAISREAVLRIISKAEEMDDVNCGYWIPDSDNVRWNIQHLPPVTPSYNSIKTETPSYNSIKTELKPCEDCISRQAVIDYAKDTCVDLDKYEDTEIFCDEIKAMPSVTPQRPRGKWIEYKVDIAPHPLHCSLCGFSNHHISNRYMREFRRCPNCGAEMEVEHE